MGESCKIVTCAAPAVALRTALVRVSPILRSGAWYDRVRPVDIRLEVPVCAAHDEEYAERWEPGDGAASSWGPWRTALGYAMAVSRQDDDGAVEMLGQHPPEEIIRPLAYLLRSAVAALAVARGTDTDTELQMLAAGLANLEALEDEAGPSGV